VLIATWNVNGIRARSQRLMEWLLERKPDVACLQELKIEEDDFPHLELRAAGYQTVLVGQQGWNGVAVIARERPELTVRELPGAAKAGARFLVARVGDLEIASVYVPNGKSVTHADYRLKVEWLGQLASWVESREATSRGAPLAVCGDFNVCPADVDSYGGVHFRGKIHHTDAERALVGRLRAAGLVDLFRARHPDDPGYAWWDYRAGHFHKNLGMRIDLILATSAIADRVTDVYVDREYRKKGKTSGAIPSDHAPVVAVLS
jgi:exodeoxyribonuclease-3